MMEHAFSDENFGPASGNRRQLRGPDQWSQAELLTDTVLGFNNPPLAGSSGHVPGRKGARACQTEQDHRKFTSRKLTNHKLTKLHAKERIDSEISCIRADGMIEWMPQTTIRILLADDHTIVRQGLKLILSAHPDLEVIGEAANGREAVELASKLKPDIVLMDVAMPELNGIEATRRMVHETPRLRVLVLSMHKEAVYVREILKAGARGYILKDAIDTELLSAVRSVAKGDGYISPAVSGALLSDYRQNVTDPLDLLSSREREVLQLIAEGKTNKEIATKLNLSVYTVDSHRGKVMEKLNLHSTGELVRFAMKHGLVD